MLVYECKLKLVLTGERPGKEAYYIMSTKSKRQPNKESTHYEGPILSKMRSAENLENSLSAGSKNRLRGYRKNLSVSRGVDHPLFDDKLKDLLSEYVWDKESFAAILDYLNSLQDGDGYLFSRDLKIYSSTQEAMERFAADDYTSFRWNRSYAKSLEDLKREFSRNHLKPEKYTCDEDVRNALPKTDTHSGYYYIKSGKKEKGDNIEGIATQLKDRKKRIRSGETGLSSPILIGFRTQASGEFDDDGEMTNTCKHKTRVVSMYDLLDIVLELQFSNPIQRLLNGKDYYAGGKNDRDISQIIHNWGHKFPKFISIDYSSFDQTISSWLIEDAFSILRCAFDLTPGQELEFDEICRNFIHKDFILSEGILHSDKGVPSGSMFTQIIDSIVNILVVRTYFDSVSERCEMIAMGDDNAIFCSPRVDIEEIASYIGKNFGLIVKTDDKSNEGLTYKSDVKFLSRYWTQSGPWRHPNQLVSRMLFPERFRKYDEDVKPEHVMFGYILTYPKGMEQLMDVGRFMREHPISASYVVNKVDSRYIPGSLAYAKEYTGLKED